MEISSVGGLSTSVRIGPVQTNQAPQEGVEIKAPVQAKQQGEPKQRQEKNLQEKDVIDIIEKANKDFVVFDRKFEFSIHEKTKQIMVKVIDTVTEEVIRELPPEKVLDMVAALWEVAGIIVDKKI